MSLKNTSAHGGNRGAGDFKGTHVSHYTSPSSASTANEQIGNHHLELLPAHRADLRRSGLSDAQIRECGFYSVAEPARVQNILGWSSYDGRLGPCLAIPYFDIAGCAIGYIRLKPDQPRATNDGKIVKYESPKNRPNLPYFPPTTRMVLNNSTAPIVFTEGEKKAAKADQDGIACIGLVGVYGFAKRRERDESGRPVGDRELLDALSAISWQGRTVYVCFDSDAMVNDKIRNAERHLAEVMNRHGAVVKIIRLPQEVGDPKVGLDDFLISRGADAFRELMSTVEATNISPNQAVDDPHRLARLFLESRYGHADGWTLRHFLDEWHVWDGAAYRSLETGVLHAQLYSVIRAEYERHNIAWLTKLASEPTGDKKPRPTVQKITKSLNTNVDFAVRAATIVPKSVGNPAWLVGPEPFPASEILACSNCLVHLPTLAAGRPGYSHAPTPNFFTLNALDYAFNLQAPRAVRWLEFLNMLWPDDQQSIDLLQEWFGLNLTLDTSYQKILMAIGPPRGGKGVISTLLRAIVGEANCVSPTLNSLGGEFGLWALLDKSTAIISDLRLSKRIDTSAIIERLLSISGEDFLSINRKNLSFVTKKLLTRFFIISNELPYLMDASGAFASRLLLLRFSRSWLGREDSGWTNRLLPERPGILLWAIEGWRRLRERGRFVQPDSGVELLTQLKKLSSPVIEFVADRCDLGPGLMVVKSNLFAAWQNWCTARGRSHPGDEASFGRNLLAAYHSIRNSRPRSDGDRIRCYDGIALKNQLPPVRERPGSGPG